MNASEGFYCHGFRNFNLIGRLHYANGQVPSQYMLKFIVKVKLMMEGIP